MVTPRIFITIPSGQSMEYGTMELPPRVIRQLVTQQVRQAPTLRAACCPAVAPRVGLSVQRMRRTAEIRVATRLLLCAPAVDTDCCGQLGYEPLEIIQAKSMEEVHEIKKKL